jgi:hypothetical protein
MCVEKKSLNDFDFNKKEIKLRMRVFFFLRRIANKLWITKKIDPIEWDFFTSDGESTLGFELVTLFYKVCKNKLSMENCPVLVGRVWDALLYDVSRNKPNYVIKFEVNQLVTVLLENLVDLLLKEVTRVEIVSLIKQLFLKMQENCGWIVESKNGKNFLINKFYTIDRLEKYLLYREMFSCIPGIGVGEFQKVEDKKLVKYSSGILYLINDMIYQDKMEVKINYELVEQILCLGCTKRFTREELKPLLNADECGELCYYFYFDDPSKQEYNSCCINFAYDLNVIHNLFLNKKEIIYFPLYISGFFKLETKGLLSLHSPHSKLFCHMLYFGPLYEELSPEQQKQYVTNIKCYGGFHVNGSAVKNYKEAERAFNKMASKRRKERKPKHRTLSKPLPIEKFELEYAFIALGIFPGYRMPDVPPPIQNCLITVCNYRLSLHLLAVILKIRSLAQVSGLLSSDKASYPFEFLYNKMPKYLRNNLSIDLFSKLLVESIRVPNKKKLHAIMKKNEIPEPKINKLIDSLLKTVYQLYPRINLFHKFLYVYGEESYKKHGYAKVMVDRWDPYINVMPYETVVSTINLPVVGQEKKFITAKITKEVSIEPEEISKVSEENIYDYMEACFQVLESNVLMACMNGMREKVGKGCLLGINCFIIHPCDLSELINEYNKAVCSELSRRSFYLGFFGKDQDDFYEILEKKNKKIITELKPILNNRKVIKKEEILKSKYTLLPYREKKEWEFDRTDQAVYEYT